MSLKNKEKLLNDLVFWTLTWPFGIILGILFCILQSLGILRVKHRQRYPKWQGRVIIVSNHPSLWEPLLLVPLVFRQYLISPKKYSPWSTPDKGNYHDKWYWFFVRPRFIPVPRGHPREEVRALIKMVQILRLGSVLIMFPEGGRTHKGTDFMYSAGGKRIRTLKHGIGDLIRKSGATVVPVWVEGTDRVLPNNGACIPRLWRKVIIKIGKPINFEDCQKLNKKEITDIVGNAILAVADED